jgi:hypothetical protein
MKKETKMEKKPCPECVIEAGALLVKARHAVKSPADAEKAGVEFKSDIPFAQAYDAIWVAIAELASPKHGVLEMEFGPGLVQFDMAWEAVLEDITNPTNDQIAKVIALGNWR